MDQIKDLLISRGGRFDPVSDKVLHFGDVAKEYHGLLDSAGLLELSHRSRLCLLGQDRAQFLHGQVTNDIKGLKPGGGCYAALVTAKGKIESDLNIFCLEQELLLDFELGLTIKVQQRLDKYIIADDVQVVDVAPHFGLASVQGVASSAALKAAGIPIKSEAPSRAIFKMNFNNYEVYAAHLPRLGSDGWDLYFPLDQASDFYDSIEKGVRQVGGCWAGETAFDWCRIEAGIPRFGVDMDETNLAPETGLEAEAIHYQKGCYIGQEVIARIRTYGQVAKALRVLNFEGISAPPAPRTKLMRAGKELGYVTSSIYSPRLNKYVGLGYVRKEANQAGQQLELPEGGMARVISPPVTITASPRG